MNITRVGDDWRESTVIPGWTRAPQGAVTRGGAPAVFRSPCHAWFGLRLAYLADAAGSSETEVELKARHYRWAWERFARHAGDIRRLVDLLPHDLAGATAIWNGIDQHEVDEAFSTVICEREPFPRVNLATLAYNHYGLRSAVAAADSPRDRKLTARDNEAAWQAAVLGNCRACGAPTISQRSYDRLRVTMRENSDLFDLSPSYRQTNGKDAPLWSERIVIAAKGVADHVIPRSAGGPTAAENLANVCAGCNYSRNSTSLEAIRVAAYRR